LVFLNSEETRTSHSIMGIFLLANHDRQYIIEKTRCDDHFERMTSWVEKKNKSCSSEIALSMCIFDFHLKNDHLRQDGAVWSVKFHLKRGVNIVRVCQTT